MELGERLCKEVLKSVPHRHFTFGIPKIRRRYFLYDQKLLSNPSHCACDSLKVFLLNPLQDAGLKHLDLWGVKRRLRTRSLGSIIRTPGSPLPMTGFVISPSLEQPICLRGWVVYRSAFSA